MTHEETVHAAAKLIANTGEFIAFHEFQDCISLRTTPEVRRQSEEFDVTFWFGTANDTWDGDVYLGDDFEAGNSSGIVRTQVDSDSTNPEAIADAILAAARNWYDGYCVGIGTLSRGAK